MAGTKDTRSLARASLLTRGLKSGSGAVLLFTSQELHPLTTSVVLCDNTWAMSILLRHWREKRGYSVRELAMRAKVGFVTVSRIENDRMSPTVAMLEKLAKALGITVRDFFPSRRSVRRRSRRRK